MSAIAGLAERVVGMFWLLKIFYHPIIINHHHHHISLLAPLLLLLLLLYYFILYLLLVVLVVALVLSFIVKLAPRRYLYYLLQKSKSLCKYCFMLYDSLLQLILLILDSALIISGLLFIFCASCSMHGGGDRRRGGYALWLQCTL